MLSAKDFDVRNNEAEERGEHSTVHAGGEATKGKEVAIMRKSCQCSLL